MTSLSAGWFCDHSPGKGRIIGAGLVAKGGNYYFEAKGISFSSVAQSFIGIAGISFQLSNPIAFDVAPPSPAAGANGYGLSYKTSGLVPVGWGYPSSIPTAG